MILQAIPIQQRRTGQPDSGSKASLVCEDYLVEINKVLHAMDDAQLSLSTPELSNFFYTELSVQENVLKVNLQAGPLNRCS